VILVTGGAGMIGSNIVHGLNERGRDDILVVDDLTDGTKFRNIADARIADYEDLEDFLARVERDDDLGLEVVFHQGACSTTTEWDGRFMMRVNYAYSKRLLHYCARRKIPLIYASSASVYGSGSTFREEPAFERPLNVYGYSKKLFDAYVRTLLPKLESPVAGLRYFNVYGPREAHKGEMASVAFHLFRQLRAGEKLRLFGPHDGYGAGEQRRDFIHVEDVVAVNLWCWDTGVSGIFNCGTGRSHTFRELAEAVVKCHGAGEIEYTAFPEHLKGRYQSFTEADTSQLRSAGYNASFRDVEAGIRDYGEWLKNQPPS
jgi:ADP-L-glycero-D-manno-heptose 6-epimerase